MRLAFPTLFLLVFLNPLSPMLAHPGHDEQDVDQTVDYLGETFLFPPTSQGYTAEQSARVERLLNHAPAPAFFATYGELMEAHEKLTPPRTSSSTGGYGDRTALGQFTYIAMGLPHKNEYRVLVYQAEAENIRYRFIAEFRHYNRFPPSLDFLVHEGKLACRIAQGPILKTFTLPAPVASEDSAKPVAVR